MTGPKKAFLMAWALFSPEAMTSTRWAWMMSKMPMVMAPEGTSSRLWKNRWLAMRVESVSFTV